MQSLNTTEKSHNGDDICKLWAQKGHFQTTDLYTFILNPHLLDNERFTLYLAYFKIWPSVCTSYST